MDKNKENKMVDIIHRIASRLPFRKSTPPFIDGRGCCGLVAVWTPPGVVTSSHQPATPSTVDKRGRRLSEWSLDGIR